MVSLIVTNYVQYVFLAAGTIIVTLVCLRHVGWGGWWARSRATWAGAGFDPVADLGLRLHPVAGPPVDRAHDGLAVGGACARSPPRTRRSGRRCSRLTGFLFLGRALIPMAWGIAALAFFWGRAEPAALPVAPTRAAQMQQLDARARRELPPRPRRGAPRAGAAAGGPPRAARPRGGAAEPGGRAARGEGRRAEGRDRARSPCPGCWQRRCPPASSAWWWLACWPPRSPPTPATSSAGARSSRRTSSDRC